MYSLTRDVEKEGRYHVGSVRSADSFLSQLPMFPLLTAVEEVELAKQIEAGVYAKHLLRTDPSREAELREISAAGDAAMERMVRANLGLVPFVAKTYLGQGLDFEELVNEGIVGLVLAVQKFDYKRGLKFSNLGVWWIRYALTVGTANTGRVIRVPRPVHAEINKLRKAENRLLVNHVTASDHELASATGLSEKRVRELRELAKPIHSLDASLTEDSQSSLVDVHADLHSPSPLDLVIAEELSAELFDIFGTLNDLEMRYLDLRYGLSTGQARSQAWIRKNLGLNANQVAAIQHRIDCLMEHARSQEGID